MFWRNKVSLKEQQQEIIDAVEAACYHEWINNLCYDLPSMMEEIVDGPEELMEDLFGSRFVQLAHIFVNAKTLLSDIEELEND